MMSKKKRPIGIFDSGVGGLTVVKEFRRHLPEEDILYFGDTARVPYGNKSRATIKKFSRQIIDFMMEKKVKMIVVACNTVSSLALPSLKDDYSVPVVGVIEPGVIEALRATKNGRIGVIGTGATISSGAYEKGIKRIVPASRVFSKSCPLFVPLVENRFFSGPVTRQIVEKYLGGMRAKHIDTLILGCTHYPLLEKVIGKVMGEVELIDSARAMAKAVKAMLVECGMEKGMAGKKASLKCYVSDDPEGFKRTAGIFLKEKIEVKKVPL